MNARKLCELYGDNGVVSLVVNEEVKSFTFDEVKNLQDEFRLPGGCKVFMIDENNEMVQVGRSA